MAGATPYLFEKYRARRERAWPEVERFFGMLPPRLFEQATLLRHNLATRYSDSGQFQEILARDQDEPVCYLHFWLLDDLALADLGTQERLETHLLPAMIFLFAAAFTQDSIRDEDSRFDERYTPLVDALADEAHRQFAAVIPAESPFWEVERAFWQTGVPDAAANLDRPLRRSILQVSAAAVAYATGRPEILVPIEGLLADLNAIFQLGEELATIRRDLVRGTQTYPIARARQAAGIPPDQPATPERVLGALLLTGVVEQLGQEHLALLDRCRTIARDAGLPTLLAYCTNVEQLIHEMVGFFSLKRATAKQAAPRSRAERPLVRPYRDPLVHAIKMAEGYLLADLTFRESWEVQRQGLFGSDEVIGAAFPAGSILEILCSHGHALAGPVDQVFGRLQASGFRYYDSPAVVPPDADDLGLLLRLYHRSANQEAHRAALQAPLRWMRAHIRPSGAIPVWFTQSDNEDGEPADVVLWGDDCVTIEANLLRGLIDYDWAAYRTIIERSALALFDRLIRVGLGATRYYVPLYSLWILRDLLAALAARLGAQQPAGDLMNRMEAVSAFLSRRIALEAGRPVATPQDAAFLMLACLTPGGEQAVKPCWITTLLKHQRYDGSWDQEPLFVTGTAGAWSTWYTSRALTSAYCYHALRIYHTHLQPAV